MSWIAVYILIGFLACLTGLKIWLIVDRYQWQKKIYEAWREAKK